MGFSISGSAAIIFAGMFLGFGIFYGAASNSFERVSDAQEGKTDRIVDKRNTAIEITLAEQNDTRLTVHVNNTGSTVLSLNKTDFLVENEYVDGWQPDATVVNRTGHEDTTTDLWQPGERLNITVTRTDVVNRTKVVTENGISATETEIS